MGKDVVSMIGRVLIDADKLARDVRIANDNSGNGMTIKERLRPIGISPSAISNSKRDLFSMGRDVVLVDYPENSGYGAIKQLYLTAICNEFGLVASDYIPQKKPQPEPQPQTESNPQELSLDVKKFYKDMLLHIGYIEGSIERINTRQRDSDKTLIEAMQSLTDKVDDLGKAQVQCMEHLKSIADGIQTMNDKYNKPSAYIRK